MNYCGIGGSGVPGGKGGCGHGGIGGIGKRFVLTVICTGSDVGELVPATSVALAVNVYVPAGTFVQRNGNPGMLVDTPRLVVPEKYCTLATRSGK